MPIGEKDGKGELGSIERGKMSVRWAGKGKRKDEGARELVVKLTMEELGARQLAQGLQRVQ